MKYKIMKSIFLGKKGEEDSGSPLGNIVVAVLILLIVIVFLVIGYNFIVKKPNARYSLACGSGNGICIEPEKCTCGTYVACKQRLFDAMCEGDATGKQYVCCPTADVIKDEKKI